MNACARECVRNVRNTKAGDDADADADVDRFQRIVSDRKSERVVWETLGVRMPV